MPLLQTHKEKPYRGGAEEREDVKKRRKRGEGKKWGFFLRYACRDYPLGDLNRLAACGVYGVYDVGVLGSGG
jgi:hypothetical protein